MKIIDRLVLALYTLSIALISFVVIIIPFDINGVFSVDDATIWVRFMRGNYIYSLIGLVFLLVSLRFLLAGFIGSKAKKQDSFLIMKNEYGEIVIYSHTIIGLVQNVVDNFSGITKINTSVNLVDGQVEINMKGEVMPEVQIPDITKELQIKVKEYIEHTTGAKVGQIKVEINNVSAPARMVK